MHAPLIDAWMAGADPLPTIDEASVSLACETVRARGAEQGLGEALIESLAVTAGELTRNQLAHARRGLFAVLAIERDGVPGLELVAADVGPGIADPRRALEAPGPSDGSRGVGLSGGSRGLGLSGARRLVHEMDVDVRWREGSCIRARAFAQRLARRREVGVLGRSVPEEAVSGDHAIFVRCGDALLCAVIDGAGHGPPARDAAERAAAVALERGSLSPARILDACNPALAGTRGVVMSVTRLDEVLGSIEHAAVGNVTTRLDAYGRTRILAGTSSMLGPRGRKRKAATETAFIARDEALLLFTDGLTSRATLAEEHGRFRDHPIVIAQHLLAEFGRDTDDALVMVVR